MRDPVVVTGMGVVSPLGCSVEGMWQRLIASRSGLRRLPDAILEAEMAEVRAHAGLLQHAPSRSQRAAS